MKTSAPVIWGARRLNDSYDPTVRKTLAEVPPALERIGAWIAKGVLNGDELNAADFQIAPSVRLLMAFEDLQPALDSRPAGEFAKRVQPSLTGRIGRVYPAEWLEPLQTAPA